MSLSSAMTTETYVCYGQSGRVETANAWSRPSCLARAGLVGGQDQVVRRVVEAGGSGGNADTSVTRAKRRCLPREAQVANADDLLATISAPPMDVSAAITRKLSPSKRATVSEGVEWRLMAWYDLCADSRRQPDGL